MEKLKKLILDYDIDITSLTEVNKDWRKVEYDNTIWGSTAGWRENRRVQVSHNKSVAPGDSEFQVGGTAMLMLGDVSFRISDQGEDSRNLGRWSYITLTGKNNATTTIFTCYCPCRSPGTGSAFVQQMLYMAIHKETLPDFDCPRQLFGYDLKIEIDKKQELDHNILVLGDFNSHYFNLCTWMRDLGLQELMEKRHETITQTCKKGKHNTPIDCVFGTANFSAIRGGYLSYSRLLGDGHRGIWVDIPKYLIYGYNPPLPIFPSARRLKLIDPRVVEKYLTYLHCSMQDNDLFHRMDELHRDATFPLSQRLIEEYEEIDMLVCRLMVEAEEQCRKLRTGTIPWSPAYKHSCLLLEYWLKRRCYFKQANTNVRELIVLQNKLKLQYIPDLNLAAINKEITSAHGKRKKCKEIAESLSYEYRTQLALAKEKAGETTAANFLRNMNSVEATRRLFRNIRRMEGKMKGGSTSKLTKQVDGREQEYTDRTSIENLCAKENERKHHLTENGSSQLLDEEFIDDLGLHGEGPAIEAVMDGTYIPPASATSATVDFLAACKAHPQAKVLATLPDVVQRYKIQQESWSIRKEKTCTYNQHMAHFKSIFSDKYISWFFFQRADIPETTGYAPLRHRKCVDLMIMKKPNCYEVSRQRTLGILDTEFNQSNKRTGHTGMNNAVLLDKIAKEQFAIKDCAASEQIVSKRCVIDHSKFKRLILGLNSSDLESCYDRIIHIAAALGLLRIGISHAKIHSMFSVIQRMIHRVRTYFGDSEITYGGDEIEDWLNKPQGVLQGNASGPTIWSLISSIIFEVLHKRGFAVEFCTSISRELFKLVGFAYVDDSDLMQMGSDPVEVLSSMQSLIKSWGELMDVTGGALSIEKSWWYMIEYIWRRGKWVAVDSGPGFDLVATTAAGEDISLKRLHAHESSKMLGIWIAPDGNKTKLISELKNEAIKWGAKVHAGNSSREEAWTALNTNISAKLKYPLPACTLTDKECKSIMWPALKSALPRSGIASNMGTKYRNGPRDYGGAGCLDLFHCQGSTRTTMVVEHTYRKTPTGYFLLMIIEDVVLETGLYGSLWKMKFATISTYIQKHSLIYSMLEYNTEQDILISTKHGELSQNREEDKSLMSLAHSLYPQNKKRHLGAIQRVRMKVGVVSLSDISTADGRKLDSNFYFYATNAKYIRRNALDWPIRHHLNQTDMTLWRKFLNAISLGTNKVLPTPLGKWKDMSKTDWLDHWDYFITEDKEFLFHRQQNNKWQRHLQKPNSHRTYYIPYLELEDSPEVELDRVSIKRYANSIAVLASSKKTVVTINPTPIVHTFGDIDLTTPKIDWFMKFLSSSYHTDRLWTLLLEGKAYAVSDGSYFRIKHTGACAWIIATPDGSQWIQGGGIIPGKEAEQDPYRSELGGQLGLAAAVSAIILPHDATPRLTVACDGKAALGRVQLAANKTKAKMKSVDLISIISELWSTSSFKITKEHVYGHQDDSGRPLTQMEALNCRVDILAKEIAGLKMTGSLPQQIFKPTELGLGTITCSNTLITSKIQQSLYKQITHQKFVCALAENQEAPVDLATINIDWEAYAKARKETPKNIQLFITKWLSGDTATGRVMVRRKQRLSSKCPCCLHEDEHLLHIITCNAPATKELRNNLLQELQVWLLTEYTHPAISKLIRLGLDKWLTNRDFVWRNDSPIYTSCPLNNQALKSQLQLDWYYFLCGMVTKEMTAMQQQYYTEIDSKKMGDRWATNLTKKMWKLLHAIWKHRCDKLYKNDEHARLSGLAPLKVAISREYAMGLGELPSLYSSFFHTTLPRLLRRGVKYLKRWFLVVRTAREANTLIRDLDDFSFDGPLRKWIGLIDNG